MPLIKPAYSKLLLLLGVLAVSGGVYLTTLGFSFVYDDYLQIVISPAIHSWRFLPNYFTTHVWQYAQPWGGGRYYRPIFSLWLLINYMLFGLHPWGWHLTTVLAHVVATGLFYWLAVRITENRAAALFAALIFGLHPAHIEAVAWISGVTEPLLAIFLLLSVLCYARARGPASPEHSRSLLPTAAVVCYAVALLEKETAVALPLILFAYEWLFAPQPAVAEKTWQRFRSALTQSIPFLVVTAAYLGVRWAVLRSPRTTTGSISMSALALTEPSVILFYLKHLLWPVDLSLSYDFAYVLRPELWGFWIPLAILVGVGLALLYWAKRSRQAAFAIIWMVATLLPVLNLKLFIREELVHDRYLYLPSMGFAMLVGMALSSLRIPRASSGRNLGQIAASLLLLGSLGAGTVLQSGYWESNLTLFRHAVSIAPENDTAVHSLALEMGNLGMYKEAIPLLRQELERKPDSFEANAALGRCYFSVASYAQAEPLLARAVELRPRTSRVPYAYLGLTRIELGQLDEAEAVIRRGLAVQAFDSDNKLIHGALGRVLERRGNWRAALAEFQIELANSPTTPGIREEISSLEARLRPPVQ